MDLPLQNSTAFYSLPLSWHVEQTHEPYVYKAGISQHIGAIFDRHVQTIASIYIRIVRNDNDIVSKDVFCLFVWLGGVYFIHSYDIYCITRSYKTLSLGFQCLYLILPGMIKSTEQRSGSSEQITKSKRRSSTIFLR